MKGTSEGSSGEHFSSHWLTIQPSLFNFVEDEVGELDEEQRLFVRVAESLELSRIARQYGWSCSREQSSLGGLESAAGCETIGI